MRIAILGTRGIPARYGGFETFAEELATRLAARGHDVAVYCRERYSEPVYRGVTLRYLPSIRHKYFDTLAHTFSPPSIYLAIAPMPHSIATAPMRCLRWFRGYSACRWR